VNVIKHFVCYACDTCEDVVVSDAQWMQPSRELPAWHGESVWRCGMVLCGLWYQRLWRQLTDREDWTS
jgi:hypothetical protein